MPPKFGDRSAVRIADFLDATAPAPLVIAVRQIGTLGLAWLAKKAPGREISLFVVDYSAAQFKRGANHHRRVAVDMLRMPNVTVRVWPRASAGAPAGPFGVLSLWVAVSEEGAALRILAGSGTLTQTGLHENVEVMAELACDDDTAAAAAALRFMSESAVEATDDVVEALLVHMRPDEGSYDAPSARNTGSGDKARMVAARVAAAAARSESRAGAFLRRRRRR